MEEGRGDQILTKSCLRSLWMPPTVLDSSNFIAKTWTDLTHVNQWIGKSILND